MTGVLLSLSTGEAGRNFLQFQPYVASDAAPARPVKCGWFKMDWVVRSTSLVGDRLWKLMLKEVKSKFATGMQDIALGASLFLRHATLGFPHSQGCRSLFRSFQWELRLLSMGVWSKNGLSY